jgi:mannonate dehydratase
LRGALDAGVRVIAAHCASLGTFADLDAPESSRPERPSFELFLRLMRDPRYPRLYGDLSSMNQVHHDPALLAVLLRAIELHPRLLYASDYPLPAVRWVVSPRRHVVAGLLDPADRPTIDEIFESNPLLFDVVLLRALRVVDGDRELRFARETFETRRVYERGALSARGSPGARPAPMRGADPSPSPRA